MNVRVRLQHSALKTPAIGNKEQDTRLCGFSGFVHKEGDESFEDDNMCYGILPLPPSFPYRSWWERDPHRNGAETSLLYGIKGQSGLVVE